jgi:hypothetical protein
VEASGEALDALVIKDAGGTLTPEKAFELVSALRQEFTTIPIHIHTHDTWGNRQLTLLEAIRANGNGGPIVVDLAVGKGTLSAPFAQPDLRDFLRLVKGSPWQNDIPVDMQKLAELEHLIAEDIMPKYPKPIAVSTQERWDLVAARMPGGMKTNMDRDFLTIFRGTESNGKSIPGWAKQIKERYKIEMYTNGGELTPDGAAFRAAIYQLVFAEMKRVTTDLGEISLVTPTSQRVGTQSMNQVINWMMAGWLTPRRTPVGFVLEPNEHFPKESRVAQYSGPMHPDLVNYYVTWTQEPELQRLYPGANRDLIIKAFQELKDPDIDLDKIRAAVNPTSEDKSVNPSLIREAFGGFYPAIYQATHKPYIDQTVVKIKKAWKGTGEPSRAAVLDIAQKFNLNILQSPEELDQRIKEAMEAHPGITESRQDFLTWSLFPKDAFHLFSSRLAMSEKMDWVNLFGMGVVPKPEGGFVPTGVFYQWLEDMPKLDVIRMFAETIRSKWDSREKTFTELSSAS